MSAARYTWANNLFEEYSKKSPTAPSSGKNLVASDLRCHASRPTLSTTFFFDRTGGGGGYREYEKSVHCSAIFALAIYQVVLWKREKEGVVIVVIVAEIKSLSHWLTHSVTRSPIELSWRAKKIIRVRRVYFWLFGAIHEVVHYKSTYYCSANLPNLVTILYILKTILKSLVIDCYKPIVQP